VPAEVQRHGLIEGEGHARLDLVRVESPLLAAELLHGFRQREADRLEHVQIAVDRLLGNLHLLGQFLRVTP